MNLIVYGSLLNPKELAKQNVDINNIEFVKVQGFRRIFNQEPSWRKVNSINRAVMNIQKDKNSWFNGIAIKGLTKEHIEDLDKRERGYNKVVIKDGDVVTYDNKVLKNCIVYVGKEGKQNSKILPNKEYFNICLEGAKAHFEEFYQDYIKTTNKNDLIET
jgi:cation transport regulator ChaC